jgi:F-type H+-transporting ATPase subunit b
MSRSLRALWTSILVGALLAGGAGRAFAEEHGGEGHGPAPHGHQAAAESAHAGMEGAGHDAAAEHAPPEINVKDLGLQFLNFGVLLFILVKFGGKAINKSLAARHNQLKADLVAAAELKAAAEAKLAKQETRLASLEKEIAEMRQGLHAEAEAEKARLIAAAEERARRIKDETSFLVEQQVREAEGRLRRESATAALKTAEEILRRAVGPADRQRMLDTFITDVERGGTTAPGARGGV